MVSRSRTEGRRLLARLRIRRVLDWIWPSFPTSWAEVPARLRPGTAQIARLTIAAVIAYLVATRSRRGSSTSPRR